MRSGFVSSNHNGTTLADKAEIQQDLEFHGLSERFTRQLGRSVRKRRMAQLSLFTNQSGQAACQGNHRELPLSTLGWFSLGRWFPAPFVE
jgi:hypothetical protein